MPEENDNVRYWKVSPGEGAYLWDEFRDNNWISIGWNNCKDWRKIKNEDLTKNPDKEKIIKVLREEDPVLFCWNSVLGNDNQTLLSFLKKSITTSKQCKQFEQLWNETSYNDYTPDVASQHLKQCNIVLDLKEFSDKKCKSAYADSILTAVKVKDNYWLDNAKIIKTNEDKTIRVFYGENVVEITLDEKDKTKATLIFKKNGQPIKLRVENENGKLMIYEYSHKQISTWADSIVLFLKIKPGHKVMIYDKNYHINALAEVIGEYEFNEKFHYSHIKRVKYQIFEKPLNIEPILNKLEKKAFRHVVEEIYKNDWDTIYNHAKGFNRITVSPKIDLVHPTRDLIEKALDKLGIKEGEAIKNELLTTIRKIVEVDGNKLVDDETAWKEILNLLKKV